MTPKDLQSLPYLAADHREAYGTDSSQYGELRVPAGAGPFPVVVLIHGGCFRAPFAVMKELGPMADALKAQGIATWNIEYRRLGEPGAGWPGTYLDVAAGVDHLRTLARTFPLDTTRVVMLGHSAGGNLALWAASRSRVPAGSPLHHPSPLRVSGVVDLAGPVDITVNVEGYEKACSERVLHQMLGADSTMPPERVNAASPQALLPIGVPQTIVIGEFEEFLPRPIAQAYVDRARQLGDSATLLVIPAVGHFEVASPHTSSWAPILRAIRGSTDRQGGER